MWNCTQGLVARNAIALSAALSLLQAISTPLHAQASFVRGDADAGGDLNISDPVLVLNYLFRGGVVLACLDAADTTDDGSLNLTDPIASLQYLFVGGMPPASPYPDCGADPTADELGCESFPSCATQLSASFTATPAAGPAPLAVTFDASSSSVPNREGATFEWDFGDGATGSGETVEHTFAADGVYAVTLTLTDGGGEVDEAMSEIRVGEIPSGEAGGIISIDHRTTRTCVPLPLETEALDVSAVFLEIRPEELPDLTIFGDCESLSSVVDGCGVERSICTFDSGGEFPEPPDLAELLEGFEGVDPGTPGTASAAGGGDVDLLPGDDEEFPVSRFLYEADPDADLFELGFDCGGRATFSFPGGEGLKAFEGSIDVPPCFTGVSPAGCAISPTTGDLVIRWDDAPAYSGTVEARLTRSSFQIGAATITLETVTIRCEFPDDAGTGTISAALLDELPAIQGFGTTTLTLRRSATTELSVERASGEGERTVVIIAGSELTISEASTPIPF